MATPEYTRTLSSAPYLGHPVVYGQLRFDYANWGSRTVIFDGSAAPAVGKEVSLEGKDEASGQNSSGWTVQLRFISPAAGRPHHPISVQLITKSAGTQSIP